MNDLFRYDSKGISSTDSPRRQALVIKANQTGDLAHIAAAAVLDDGTDIIVIFVDETDGIGEEGLKQKAGRDALLQYFNKAAPSIHGTATTPEVVRVKHIVLKDQASARALYVNITSSDGKRRDPSKWIHGTDPQAVAKIKKSGFINLDDPKDPMFVMVSQLLQFNEAGQVKDTYFTVSPVGATYIIAQLFSLAVDKANVYKTLAERLGSGRDPKDIVADFETEVKFTKISWPSGDKPVLLLWSRYTGGNSPWGYNPEGDSDLLGQKQLIDLAERDFDVITIGHDPSEATKDEQVHAKYHLGEFYNTNAVGSSRSNQLSFMLGLMQKFSGNLYQFGQKTGGMDAGALVGIPTMFIEHALSGAEGRMRSWVKRVPWYTEANIQTPPSLLGRSLERLEKQKVSITKELKDTPEKLRRCAKLFYLSTIDLNLKDDEAQLKFSEIESMDPEAQSTKIQELIKELSKAPTPGTTEVITIQGYDATDLKDPIGQNLNDMVKDYSKGKAIIRSQDGKYIIRP